MSKYYFITLSTENILQVSWIIHDAETDQIHP